MGYRLDMDRLGVRERVGVVLGIWDRDLGLCVRGREGLGAWELELNRDIYAGG